MPDAAKDAWNDVGERFSSWGRRLADRYKETVGSDATPQEAQRKLEEAARELGDQLSRAFTALGDTLKDDNAEQDLRSAVGAIGDAVAATVTEAGAALRRVGQGGPSTPERPDEPAEG